MAGASGLNTTSDVSGDATASGSYALANLTLASDSYDSAFGSLALVHDTTGIDNTATGFDALNSLSTGTDNTATGYNALGDVATGSWNVAVGSGAGSAYTGSESDNIDIGGGGIQGENYTIHIGVWNNQQAAYIAGIDTATVSGGVPVFVVPGTGQLGVETSSQRFKRDIQDMGAASEAILALRPVTYKYKADIDPKGMPQYGLVAEEVEKVSPDLVVRDANGQVYTVRYEAVNAMLLNEFHKEHAHVKEQDQVIAQQQAEIEALKAQFAALAKAVANK